MGGAAALGAGAAYTPSLWDQLTAPRTVPGSATADPQVVRRILEEEAARQAVQHAVRAAGWAAAWAAFGSALSALTSCGVLIRCDGGTSNPGNYGDVVGPGRSGPTSPNGPPRLPELPKWLENALRTVERAAEGSTVNPRAVAVAARTADTAVTVLNGTYTDERSKVTVEDDDNQPRPSGVALPDEDDDCYGLQPNTPEYDPMEPVDYQKKYKGKPRTGATRATGARVCLTEINKDARLTSLQPAGEQSSTELVRGHLVAHMFFGSNQRDNMVSLWDKTNSPDMLSIEYEVKRHVEAGETVHYGVTPLYSDGTNPIPYAVHIEALGNRGWKCSVDIFNTQQRTGQRGGC